MKYSLTFRNGHEQVTLWATGHSLYDAIGQARQRLASLRFPYGMPLVLIRDSSGRFL